ncbi:galactoside alpha-(1,2)-fucosyltransferase 2-like [Physella acuta]|uniref:galactoside alpha-(1,2)-fucosyltransferase 2-like n=1 Tax=Physella acuta TaxID=109671 RepID=UPI0027DC57C5|nr:galactoside alpha-(1,2)-fucosyltransferase 2-like [Physella acuta]
MKYIFFFVAVNLVVSFLVYITIVSNFWASSTTLSAFNIFEQKSIDSELSVRNLTISHNELTDNMTVQALSTTHPSTSVVTMLPTSGVHTEGEPLYVVALEETLVGRLGNQMFIYAAMLGIARTQNRIPLIVDGTLLEKAFQLNHIGRVNTTGWKTMVHSKHGTFDPTFMNLPKINVILYGCFQSWKFFVHVEDEIRREFTFHPNIHEKTTRFYGSLRQNNTDTVFVGVHVRRSDFLSAVNVNSGYGVPQMSYFINAINYIRRVVSNNTMFLVASDDMEWCKGNFNDSDVKLLEPDSAENHLSILSRSDHVIISGGTYGWWAAWLTKGLKIYFNGFPSPGSKLIKNLKKADYYPKGWIALDN